jgi:hypothetical protein
MGGSEWSSAVLLRPGGAGLGQAWLVLVGLGPERRGVAWLGAVFEANMSDAGRGRARLGTARLGEARRGLALLC